MEDLAVEQNGLVLAQQAAQAQQDRDLLVEQHWVVVVVQTAHFLDIQMVAQAAAAQVE